MPSKAKANSHTCRVVSWAISSLRLWSSSLDQIADNVRKKPHCKLLDRRVACGFIDATLALVDVSRRGIFALTNPGTMIFPLGRKCKASKLPARGVSYSSRKRSWVDSTFRRNITGCRKAAQLRHIKQRILRRVVFANLEM